MLNSFITNLMVADMVTSLRFYHDTIGAPIAFTVDAEQNTAMPGEISEKAVFASLRIGDYELMLQERTNLIADSAAFDEATPIGASATFYLRVDDVDAIVARLPQGTPVVKPLETTWYGMREIWIRDPDGYVLTIGTPDGDAPTVSSSS